MKIVFFGTSSFAATILEYLLQHSVNIVAVVTRPDRPFGRAQKIKPPPVKEALLRLRPDLPLLQPEKASTPAFAETLASFAPDLFVVVAYGEILKQNILDIPKKGCINVHASLLPKYRGAAPIQRCLWDGCKETGVTIMEMVLEMDAGDMLAQAKMDISDNMTRGGLEQKLQELACPLLLEVIKNIERGSVQKISQNPQLVIFAPKIPVQEEKISWHEPAQRIHNQIRALSPQPGAWCQIKIQDVAKRLKIKRSQVVHQSGEPGAILSSHNELVVACGQEALQLIEVQLEGKKSLSIQEFLRGMNSKFEFIP